MDLKESALFNGVQGAHWYYAAKAALLLRYVRGTSPRRVLDVGAGSGFFARTLLGALPVRSGVCLDTGYERDWLESVDGKPLEFRRATGVTDADLILLMDVLEHVDDDVAVLRSYVETAPPGARFVISVPAFSWLWSAHDTFLGHRRRYTLRRVSALLVAAGLQPTSVFYFYGLVFPAAAVRRLAHRLRLGSAPVSSDLREHAPWLNALLHRACLAELRVARFNRAFGLSVFAVAEKAAVQEPADSSVSRSAGETGSRNDER